MNEKILKREWVNSTIKCDEYFEEQEDDYKNTIILIETKDKYEIIVDVDNTIPKATIREGYFQKVKEKCKVEYDANEGTGSMEIQEARAGFYTILQSNNFEREYYSFVGWCEDKDGIIDHLELFQEEVTEKYGENVAEKLKGLLIEIAITNTVRKNKQFAQYLSDKINEIEKEIEKYENTGQRIEQIIENKKLLLKELNKVEQILGQKAKLKKEYEKINEDETIEQKIFNINVLKKQLTIKKQQLLEQIGKSNEMLNPSKYLEEKNKLIEKRERLQLVEKTQKEVEKNLIEFIENFLKCFEKLIDITNDEEEIVRLIYQFRYFMLLPFNLEKSVKDIKKVEKKITNAEKKLVQKAIKKKVISDVPEEIMKRVFETRIIILEDLFYKITKKEEKQYVQIFDENISEEKFEIKPIEKAKLNKKIKIFM